MKFSDYKPKASVTLKLIDDFGNPFPEEAGTWEVAGDTSPEFQDAAKAILKNKNLFASDYEVSDEENKQVLSACVLKWDEEFWEAPCRKDEVYQILSENPGILRQLEACVSDRARYFPDSYPSARTLGRAASKTGRAGPDGTDAKGTARESETKEA